MRIGIESWIGCGDGYKLLEVLVEFIHIKGLFFLNHVSYTKSNKIWRQQWN